MTDSEIGIFRDLYVKTVNALNMAEDEYNINRRRTKKRAIFEFVAAQELVLAELAGLLGVKINDDI